MTAISTTKVQEHVFRPGGRFDKRAGRRAELLAASLAVIRRDGASASMDAMAAEAGITKPILYRHFGDRDGLIAAVADLFARDLADSLTAALSATRDGEPRRRIEAAVDGYVKFIEADPALYGFLTRETAVASPALQNVVDRVAKVLQAAMDDAFEEAGIDDRPTKTWSYAIVGMVHLAGARWVADARSATRKELVQQLTDLIADGLLPRDQPAGPDPAVQL